MNIINNAAHAVAPSMFEKKDETSMRGKMIPTPPPMPTGEDLNKHYLIPAPPPMPTEEDLNKHYLSRDKRMENATHMLSSAANYVGEWTTDLKAALPSAESLKTTIPAAIGLGPRMDERGIPVPPPQPTQEMLHKHYLIPMAPPLPTAEMMNKHYLIPAPPPLPTDEMLHRHYMSRDKTLENASSLLRSTGYRMSEFAAQLTSRIPFVAGLVDVKDYLMETPIEKMQEDVIETLNPTPVDSQGIPIPPPLPSRELLHKHYLIPLAPPQPTREMMHKHYLIPLAPPIPTREMMNKHYLSRNKTLENAGNAIRSAVNYAGEVIVDNAVVAKQAIVEASEIAAEKAVVAKDIVVDNAIAAKETVVEGISAIPEKAAEARDIASEKAAVARDVVVDNAIAAKDAVVDGAVQLKEKVMPAGQSSPVGLKYPRSEVISESPILKHKTVGARRIVARKDYDGFKPLIQKNSLRI